MSDQHVSEEELGTAYLLEDQALQNAQSWMTILAKYLNKEELALLRIDCWDSLIPAVRQVMELNAEPHDPQVQELARMWESLVMLRRREHVKRKFWYALHKEQEWLQHIGLTMDMLEFMHSAIKLLHPAKESILQSGQASASALIVAKYRAVHQLLDTPKILDDPIALSILGPIVEAEVRRDASQFDDSRSQNLRAGLAMRNLLAENELAGTVELGVRQYVVLGAGLDTFAFRNKPVDSAFHVYEVDHPATQSWKQSLLKEASITVPESMTFVPVDFEESTLVEELQRAGFHADQPAFFSCLGVSYYITKEELFDTLRFIVSLPKNTAIVFDYAILPSLLPPKARMASEYLIMLRAEQGEAWKTFFDPETLIQELKEIGFSEVEDLGATKLNADQFQSCRLGYQNGGESRIICVRV